MTETCRFVDVVCIWSKMQFGTFAWSDIEETLDSVRCTPHISSLHHLHSLGYCTPIAHIYFPINLSITFLFLKIFLFVKVRMLTYSHEVVYLLFIRFPIEFIEVRKFYRKLCVIHSYVSEKILSVVSRLLKTEWFRKRKTLFPKKHVFHVYEVIVVYDKIFKF